MSEIYKERMKSCYPQVINKIAEFKAIIDSEYKEFADLHLLCDEVAENAYLGTMHEARIVEWEKALDIKPLPISTLEDRREVIMARLRGQDKLNTAVINAIVNTFTGGKAHSYIQDSTLVVEVEPPSGNKNYVFENLEYELASRVPCHIGLSVIRKYNRWIDIKEANEDWSDVHKWYYTWEDVLLANRKPYGKLDVTPFTDFILA